MCRTLSNVGKDALLYTRKLFLNSTYFSAVQFVESGIAALEALGCNEGVENVRRITRLQTEGRSGQIDARIEVLGR